MKEVYYKKDPIVHVYATFLGEYNPKLRKARGSFVSPLEAVDFIVRSICIFVNIIEI